MKTVWVTRTQPGAEATAARVRAAGFAPFVAPLLEVIFATGGPIDVVGVDALAFTSANGVRAFAARSDSRNLPVFAVGRGTAAAAREAGFANVTASNGDVLTLAGSIPNNGMLLHPGAAEPSADLVAAMAGRGINAQGIVVYRTVAAKLSAPDLATAAASDFVLLQSAKAAKAFADLQLEGPQPVCLSQAIADAIAHAPFSSATPPLSPAGGGKENADSLPLPAGEATRAGARAVGGFWAKERLTIAAAPTEDALIAALIEAAS